MTSLFLWAFAHCLVVFLKWLLALYLAVGLLAAILAIFYPKLRDPWES